MIRYKAPYFHLSTSGTSYVMKITERGTLEHVCYGVRITSDEDIPCIEESGRIRLGTVPYADEAHQTVFPENLLMEISAGGRGDFRSSSIELWKDGSMLIPELKYEGYRIYEGKADSFPASALADETVSTLEITLADPSYGLAVILRYSVYEEEDVILRSMRLENRSEDKIAIKQAASLLLDIPYGDFTLYSYDGAWARERKETAHELKSGITVIDSKLGISGNEHNPLVFLENRRGEAYGFNLIYSGNHMESAEVSPFGRIRFISGINPYGFMWNLEAGSTFETPEAVMTCSRCGRAGASANFQNFVRKYIIRGRWKDRERPVLVNNWEATYFDFTQEKILALADEAASAGIELFVLDDGWFSGRRNDSCALGDWEPDRERLPDGLKALADRIIEKGLMFGLWVEPEMISINSELFRKHPDWMVRRHENEPVVCRHQYVLDITKREVQDYLFEKLSAVFSSCRLSYVKWDMNRTITDYPDPDNGQFLHRYTLSLYSLLGRITAAFPEILFEGCASGGNRFDLGLLCFMPQIWTSDNTDLHDRVAIQEGTLMGYPSSSMTAHVAASPSHQCLRRSRMESRFNIACFATLGYELDLCSLSMEDKLALRRQTAFYKEHRTVLQRGIFSKLVISSNQRFWYMTYGKETMAAEIQTLNECHSGREDRLFFPDAKDGCMYEVSARREIIPLSEYGSLSKGKGYVESEEFSMKVSGNVLRNYGLPLGPQFTGNGVDGDMRLLGDFGSRIYVIKEIKNL